MLNTIAMYCFVISSILFILVLIMSYVDDIKRKKAVKKDTYENSLKNNDLMDRLDRIESHVIQLHDDLDICYEEIHDRYNRDNDQYNKNLRAISQDIQDILDRLNGFNPNGAYFSLDTINYIVTKIQELDDPKNAENVSSIVTEALDNQFNEVKEN